MLSRQLKVLTLLALNLGGAIARPEHNSPWVLGSSGGKLSISLGLGGLSIGTGSAFTTAKTVKGPSTSFTSQTTSTSTSSNAAASAASTALVNNQWVWIPVAETQCSDGSTTGFAVNANLDSTDLVVDFQGGGICWDYESCYIYNLAANMGVPFNGTTFVQQGLPSALASYGIMMRSTSANPFYQANYAFVPYCTGDLHAGNATVTYSPNANPTYHHGYINGNLILKAIKTALPNIQRTWMTGSSAGGFGAIYQYANAVNVFGYEKRIDIIADSAVDAGSAYFYPSLNIQVISTNLCPNCNSSNFDSYLPAIASLRPNSRFAALSYANDTVLPGYEGVSSETMSEEIVNSFTILNKNSNAKGFIAKGAGHAVMTNPGLSSINGISLANFITNMVSSTTWTAGM